MEIKIKMIIIIIIIIITKIIFIFISIFQPLKKVCLQIEILGNLFKYI